MNYYPHHIGDFDKATRHLTRLERSIYRDLMDLYYDTEKSIPLDKEWVCRKVIARSNEESTAVEQVLNEFFTETSTGWYHERCEEEISHYRTNNSQKSQAGKASAASKALKKQQALNGNSTAVATPVERLNNGAPTNQEPRTKNQEPSNSVPKGTAAITAKSPEDLTKEELWSAGKSLLAQQGLPTAQCGSFIGKLVKDYGGEVVVEAVRAAVVERPANAQEFLVGACRSRDQKNAFKRTSSFLNLLPANSPRIPMADDPDNLPAWMRDDVELIHA